MKWWLIPAAINLIALFALWQARPNEDSIDAPYETVQLLVAAAVATVFIWGGYGLIRLAGD